MLRIQGSSRVPTPSQETTGTQMPANRLKPTIRRNHPISLPNDFKAFATQRAKPRVSFGETIPFVSVCLAGGRTMASGPGLEAAVSPGRAIGGRDPRRVGKEVSCNERRSDKVAQGRWQAPDIIGARNFVRGLEQPRGAGLRRLANAIPGGPKASAAGAALAARRAIAAFQGMVRLGGGSNSP